MKDGDKKIVEEWRKNMRIKGERVMREEEKRKNTHRQTYTHKKKN